VRDLSPARKVTMVFGLAAVLTLLVGAGFSFMSASNAPTSLETAWVRWIALLCILVAVTAYVIDRRSRGDDPAPPSRPH
jgi:hypothetical protein